MERTIPVKLADRSYDVRVGSGLLDGLGPFVASLGTFSAIRLVSDSNVARLHGREATDSAAKSGLACTLLEFPAGEASKTLTTYARLLDDILLGVHPIDRKTLIVALGGGVTGDLAGFVAATALRGLPWIQCPTTLLADVDASVGGKTGVDHAAGKNLIGAFHQPRGVLIDVKALKTLSDAEFANGLAECVKHAVIRDPGLLDFIESAAQKILARDEDTLVDLVARNVAIKAAVVSADEREAGERAHLNLGHTIGHAIEACEGFGAVSHGQAVALGMVAACRMAVARGRLGAESAARIERALTRLSLPIRRKSLNSGELLRIMQRDKKARGGNVRMVLPVSIGEVMIADDVPQAELIEAIEYLESPER